MMRIILEQLGFYLACVLAVLVTLLVGSVAFTGLSGTPLILALLVCFGIAVFVIYRGLRWVVARLGQGGADGTGLCR